MSMKSGRGRLSSTNSLTEKILRNCPCEYAAWSPSCQSPTCQSPAVNIRSPISNQSHGTLRLMRSARNQGVGCIFAVENIDHRGSRLIGPAWGETPPASEIPPHAFPNSRPERPIASCATISVIIGRIPDGDKHRFVNYDFPFPEPDGPRLNSIETGERNWVKAPFRDAQATSATDNHKNIIFDRSSKAKLGQGIGACDDQFFRPWFSICGTRSASRPHPNRAGKITEPTGAQGRSTLSALP
jgi:hypothetical protein